MTKTNNILIVGGAGYIGGHLSDILSHIHGSVIVYDNLLFEDRYLKPLGRTSKFINGDIRDREKLKAIITEYKPSHIIWLAAMVGDGACQVNPALTKELNEESVKWLVDSNFPAKIVFTSTCSVYGANHKKDLTEDETPNPLSIYAETKLNAEQYILKHRPDSVVFRLGTLYGVGDAHSRLRFDLVANVLTLKACLNEDITVFGGEQWRPMLHVRDVTSAIEFAIETNISGLYNLSDANYQISELASTILRHVPQSKSKVTLTDMKFEDLRNYHVSNKKIMDTGWIPGWYLFDGIETLAKIILEKRIKNPKDSIYSNEQHMKVLENYGQKTSGI